MVFWLFYVVNLIIALGGYESSIRECAFNKKIIHIGDLKIYK